MGLRIAVFKEALDTFVYLARINLAEIRQMLHDRRKNQKLPPCQNGMVGPKRRI